MKPLITPMINLNGNSADDLILKLKAVLETIRELEAAMVEASDITHGRNFQTADDPFAARVAADDAWRERWAMIDKFQKEVTELAIRIQDQKRR